MNTLQLFLWLEVILLKCYWALNLHLSPFGSEKQHIFAYDLEFILINIKNVKGAHYRWHLDEHFTVVFMIVSHSPQMLLLEKCIPISHVTLETVP